MDNNQYYGNGGYERNAGGMTPEERRAEEERRRRQENTEAMLAATSAAGHAGGSMFGGFSYGASHPEQFEAATEGNVISSQSYNLTIGLLLAYGFLINALMCFVFGDAINGVHPAATLVIYIVGCLVGSLMCIKAKNAVLGFVGYNLIVVPMGLLISPLLAMYDIGTIRYAFCILGVITLAMIGLCYAFEGLFLSMGRVLMTTLILTLIGEVVLFVLNVNTEPFVYIFLGIFMLFVGYDWAIAQQRPKTRLNAIRSAFILYVDLINILIRLLRLLSKRRD